MPRRSIPADLPDSAAPQASGPSAPIALYVRIASILKGRIVRGEWPAGTLVPGVDQLATLYGVARHTARQALQTLVAEGLIVSERGRGSTVVYTQPPRVEFDGSLLYTLAPPPPGHRITVLERRHGVVLNTALFPHGKPWPGSPAAAASAASAAAGPYTLIRKVHAQDGVPIGYFEVCIPTEIWQRLPRGADARAKVARLLVAEGIDIGRGEEVLTVESADWNEAELLGVQMASPIARIVRTRVDRARRIVYAANNIYRADRFKQTRLVSNYHYRSEGDLPPAAGASGMAGTAGMTGKTRTRDKDGHLVG